jgi:hypothetical protein
MNAQTVYQVELFDQTPAHPGCEQPRYVLLIHFTELARQMIKAQRQTPDLMARKIAKNLIRIENSPGGMRITHPLVDLDTLGEPTAYPDGADSRVWVTAAPQGSVYYKTAS